MAIWVLSRRLSLLRILVILFFIVPSDKYKFSLISLLVSPLAIKDIISISFCVKLNSLITLSTHILLSLEMILLITLLSSTTLP